MKREELNATAKEYVVLSDETRRMDKADIRFFIRGMAEGASVQIKNTVYKGVKRLNVRQLEKGMVVLAGYAHYNSGIDAIEVLGFTATDPAYGKGGIVKFNSVKEVMADEGVKSVKALEAKQDENEYGHQTYAVVRDLEYVESDVYNESGPWYYLCDGRWSRGSGAEALSFVLLEMIGDVCPTCPHILADGESVCPTCVATCHTCGREVPSGESSCLVCGTPH